MTETSQFVWKLGGLTPSPLAWALLAVLAFLIVVVFVWSYRLTLQKLSPLRRVVLSVMRTGFLALLVLFLANPSRVERELLAPSKGHTLAVLVDRSDSMLQPDNRKVTRLDAAAKAWNGFEGDLKSSFERVGYFSFGETLTPAGGMEPALSQTQAGHETHLYESLNALLGRVEHYTDVVVLTDGLDTTNQDSSAVVKQALARQTAIHFLPGQNRVFPTTPLNIRETSVPPLVRPKTKFVWRSLVEAYSREERDVPVSLWMGDKALSQATIHFQTGRNVIPWNVDLTADAEGIMPLEMRLGEGTEQRSVGVSVQVKERGPVPVLYYQGGLDWGFRFLAGTLRRDPSFRLAAIFNPAPGKRMTTGSPGVNPPDDLPSTRAELDAYNLIVLSNITPENLTDAQQNALVDYVRCGGGILFVCPGTEACQAFYGSKLEGMLPVVFSRTWNEAPTSTSATRFRDMMLQVRGGGNGGMEKQFATQSDEATDRTPLSAFQLTDGAKSLPIFKDPMGGDPIVPQFSRFSVIARAKPGAEVLAQEPKSGQVLFAVQTFGEGRSAVLASDSLWRWKLSLPSDSKKSEVFWQQLLQWLSKQPGRGLFFEKVVNPVGLHQKLAFQIGGVPQGSRVTVTALSPSGKKVPLGIAPTGTAGRWLLNMEPDEPGEWKVVAEETSGLRAEMHLRVDTKTVSRELSMETPDVIGMKKLAEATGGQLMAANGAAPWKAAAGLDQPIVLAERQTALWNKWPLLIAALGLYVAELLLRRRWKLL
jgi:hypothetical protein